MAAGPATANMANFTPVPTDFSITQMLMNTFGNVTGSLFGPGAPVSPFVNVIGQAFLYFNSAVLFFGTVILAYVTVFGIMNTANDGQVLGKRWSTLFTPLRISVSAASLIPTASNFSIIQLVVLQVVVWGVGIADTTWTNIVQFALNPANGAQSALVSKDGSQTDARTLATNVLASKICAIMLTDSLSQITSANGATNDAFNCPGATSGTCIPADPQPTLTLNAQGLTKVTSIQYNFADLNPSGTTANGADICGAVAINVNMGPAVAPGAAGPGTTPNALLTQNLAAVQNTQALAGGIVAANLQAAYGALAGVPGNPGTGLDGIAKSITCPYLSANIAAQNASPPVNNCNGPVAQPIDFQNAVNTYLLALKGMNTAAATAIQASPTATAFINQTTSLGWVFAGSWHRQLSQIQDAVNEVAKVTPKPTPPSPDLVSASAPSLDPGFLTGLQSANQDASALVAGSYAAWAAVNQNNGTNGSPSAAPGAPALNINGGTVDVSAAFHQFTGSVGQYIVRGVVDVMNPPAAAGWSDPVLQVKNLGDWTMWTAETIIAAQTVITESLLAAKATKDVVSGNVVARAANYLTGWANATEGVLNFLLKSLEILWGLISPMVWGLLYVGYFMSIFLPMVPWMIFSLGVVGWLIAVAESVVAAPLWMVMHMTPEGNDSFIGGQQQGYLLLLSVFFRPVLMILGLMLAMIMLRPIVDFINIGFVGAMAVTQSDSWTGLGSILGFLCVYAFVMMSVFFMVFGLSQELPDRVLRWIGAGIGSLGESNALSKIEGGASGQARTAINSGSRMQASRADKISSGQSASSAQSRHEQMIQALGGRKTMGTGSGRAS
jgi:conjugal transfer/type IV secretion protein DotA/TraY